MNEYLVTLIGLSGAKYALTFECEDIIDAEMMLRDCQANGFIEGKLIEVFDSELFD